MKKLVAFISAISLLACVGCGNTQQSNSESTGSTSSTSPSETAGYGNTDTTNSNFDRKAGDDALDKYFDAMNDSLLYESNSVSAVSESKKTSDSRIKNGSGQVVSGYNQGLDSSSSAPTITGDRTIAENDFISVQDNPISTFGADVDTASFSYLKSLLLGGYSKSIDINMIRTEEVINYFHYDYEEPQGDDVLCVNTQLCDCPWNTEHKLLSVGLQAKDIELENRDPMNIVFLVDTSGSMGSCIDQLKSGLSMLSEQLTDKDRVSIVTYAGNWDIVLENESGANTEKILNTVESLMAGGCTNGSGGITAAYELANQYFIKGGNNRVVLLTDGDFNMGITSADELRELIEKNRKTGIFLSVMGFRSSKNGDLIMETLADRGNGNFHNITDEQDARKALVSDFAGNMFTVAKDTKFKVTFNSDSVSEYRLIGYENRALTEEEYNDDTVDSGDIGLGHQLTILYEIIPNGNANYNDSIDIAELNFKYKKPDADTSDEEKNYSITTDSYTAEAKGNIALAASATELVMLLTNNKFKGTSSIDDITKLKELCGINDEYTDIYGDMIKNYSYGDNNSDISDFIGDGIKE